MMHMIIDFINSYHISCINQATTNYLMSPVLVNDSGKTLLSAHDRKDYIPTVALNISSFICCEIVSSFLISFILFYNQRLKWRYVLEQILSPLVCLRSNIDGVFLSIKQKCLGPSLLKSTGGYFSPSLIKIRSFDPLPEIATKGSNETPVRHVSIYPIRRQLTPRHNIEIMHDRKVTRFNLFMGFRYILWSGPNDLILIRLFFTSHTNHAHD